MYIVRESDYEYCRLLHCIIHLIYLSAASESRRHQFGVKATVNTVWCSTTFVLLLYTTTVTTCSYYTVYTTSSLVHKKYWYYRVLNMINLFFHSRRIEEMGCGGRRGGRGGRGVMKNRRCSDKDVRCI